MRSRKPIAILGLSARSLVLPTVLLLFSAIYLPMVESDYVPTDSDSPGAFLDYRFIWDVWNARANKLNDVGIVHWDWLLFEWMLLGSLVSLILTYQRRLRTYAIRKALRGFCALTSLALLFPPVLDQGHVTLHVGGFKPIWSLPTINVGIWCLELAALALLATLILSRHPILVTQNGKLSEPEA